MENTRDRIIAFPWSNNTLLDNAERWDETQGPIFDAIEYIRSLPPEILDFFEELQAAARWEQGHVRDRIKNMLQISQIIESWNMHRPEFKHDIKKILILEILKGNISQDDVSEAIGIFDDPEVNLFALADRIRREIHDRNKIDIQLFERYMTNYFNMFHDLDPTLPAEKFCLEFRRILQQ